MSEGQERTRRAIYDAVADRKIEVVGERDGEHVFRLTEEGTARANEILDEILDAHPESDGFAAADALVARLEIPFRVAAELLELRKRERAENSQAKATE